MPQPRTTAATPDLSVPFWRQLRWQLILTFIVLAVLPAGVIEAINLSLTRNQAEQQVFNQLETVVQLKQNQLTGRLHDSQAALRFILSDPIVERMAAVLQEQQPMLDDQAPINALLQQLATSTTQGVRFSKLLLYTPSGLIVAASDPLQIGKLVNRQPYFAPSLTQSYIQPPYYSLSGGALSMVITEPIRDPAGQLIGVLAGELDLNFLARFMLERSGLGETGETYLVSLESNYLLTPSRFEGYPLTQAYHSEGIDRALRGESGAGVYYNYRNPPVEVFGSYRWIPELQAGLIAEIEVSEALASYLQARTSSIGLTLLSILLAAAVGLFMTARISQPIGLLTRAAVKVAGGDLSQQVTIPQRNEMGVLATVFNTMTNELKQIHEDLEQRIIARTAELAKATEEAQAARAAAEEANRLKDRFLANMSHELRTPLNSIINFSYILQTGMRGELNEDQKDYLTRIYDSGEHLLGLINDILDLAKIEAGRMDLFKEPLKLPELVRGVMSTATGLLKDKPVELRQELAPDLPQVMADRTRIRQVLLNLLSNAAKFTDRGSITVHAAQEGEYVVLSVSDTGIGIPPEHLDHIFEEFRQIDGEANRRYEGTGLGLAICRRLVEMHGGQVWAESTVGEGSTFFFTLPIVEASTPAAAPALAQLLTAAQEQEGEGRTVVVIDDDRAAIEIIAAYLSKDGYTVYGISDSRIALEETRRLKPAAIILDILMPYKDGWEVLSELKTDPELQTVPVMLYTIVEDQKMGYYLGASAYLTKPINEEQLRSTVARLVSQGSRILVIDDDPNAREIITQHLKRVNSYQILTASNGREGLEQIAKAPPDLIILDLMMPEVDGFAVLEQLDASPQTQTIPVIVLTAKDLTAAERGFLQQRVKGLLSKGVVSAEHILSNVAQVLKTANHPTVEGTC
ncbi:MAG: hypothetical protein KatS3mg057_2128 [Herpetosiphonaceae bacterium]|nr:MAG: hypothetical protein KatS3mg057_2128 [Herpetosiphonaceae bacterium]